MANVTLESEPIQKTVTIEVLRVPIFGNEDRGTRVKPIISHGCNRDRGRINKSSLDLFANAYECVYLISERGLLRSEVPTTRRYPEIQLYSYIHIAIVLWCFGWRQNTDRGARGRCSSYEIGYDPRNRGGGMRERGYTYMTT